jgi:hypothetical protein
VGVVSFYWTESVVRDGLDRVLDQYGCAPVEAAFTLDEKASSKRGRSVSGVASVQEVSRTRLLIDLGGLSVTRYNRDNPVVLACHHYIAEGTLMPGAIGTVGRMSKREGRLEFSGMTFDTDPVAEAWYQKVLSRTVRMVSVGVLPLEVEFVQPGKEGGGHLMLIKSELMELSVTPVGANRGALIDPPSAPVGESESVRDLMAKVERLAAEMAELRQFRDGVVEAAQEEKRQSIDRLLQAAGLFNHRREGARA